MAAGQPLQPGGDHGQYLYVVSYHTNVGFYSANNSYFTSAVTNGPLTAPATGNVAGGNGVYAYGSGSSFPTNTFRGSNYWVDVVFQAPTGSNPVATNKSGFVTTENTALTIQASQLLAGDSDPNGFSLSLQSVSNPTNGTVTLNNVSPQTVTFTPTGGYTGPASFTYTITNGHGGTASAQVSLTVNPTPTPTEGFIGCSVVACAVRIVGTGKAHLAREKP